MSHGMIFTIALSIFNISDNSCLLSVFQYLGMERQGSPGIVIRDDRHRVQSTLSTTTMTDEAQKRPVPRLFLIRHGQSTQMYT